MQKITAKKLGFKKGDLVSTGPFVGIVVGNVNSHTPLVEVWGFAHETGSCYATDLELLSYEEWCGKLLTLGYKTADGAMDAQPMCAEAIAALQHHHQNAFHKVA